MELPSNLQGLSNFSKEEAIMTRWLVWGLAEDGMNGERENRSEFVSLKPRIASAIHSIEGVLGAPRGSMQDDIVAFRRKLTSKHKLMESRRKKKASETEGRWESRLTSFGWELYDWFMEEENESWGTPDHPVVTKAVAPTSSEWTLGEDGFYVDERLPFALWQRVSKEAKAKGYVTAILPPDRKIFTLVIEDGKKVAKVAPGWSKLNSSEEESPKTDLEAENERLRQRIAALEGKN